MISIDEAIKIMSNYGVFGCGYCHQGDDEVEEAFDMAINALKNSRWIPVSERLPSDDAEVLVSVYFMGLKQTHKNGWNDHIKPHCYVDIAKYDEGEWLSYSDEYKVARKRHKVIAWMELPKPYEVEEE